MSIVNDLNRRMKGKVVFVGVGNVSCCDDGVGIFFAKQVVETQSLKSLPVGDYPELYVDEIINERPDVVIFIDATELASPPGSIGIIELTDLPPSLGNTHQPPLSTIMTYINMSTGADTFLLGIQPEKVSVGYGLCYPVAETIKSVTEIINNIAGSNNPGLPGEKL